MSVTDKLIELQARQLQKLSHGKARNAELAAELEALNEAVHDAAFELEDMDEPGAFPRVLLQGARQHKEDPS